jgi:hypothetical protein
MLADGIYIILLKRRICDHFFRLHHRVFFMQTVVSYYITLRHNELKEDLLLVRLQSLSRDQSIIPIIYVKSKPK